MPLLKSQIEAGIHTAARRSGNTARNPGYGT